MIFKYYISNISVEENLIFSILRKRKLFNDAGNEIKLADSEANFRCVLEPNENIDSELSKLCADGAELNPELIALINDELKATLKIWWTPERVELFKASQNKQSPKLS
ncbi:MAG: hypothetical protein VKK42_03420 [Lyngbya sp.]|nr:hypothetical protein [Lyngbya sp.]